MINVGLLANDLESVVTTRNLTWRIAARLDELGWEGGHVKGKLAGSRRKWIDDDHYITVGLNNRYLTPSQEFVQSTHRVKVGLAHRGVMDLFDRLFSPQGGYSPFVGARMDMFGAPKYFSDPGCDASHGEFVEFDEVMRLIDDAHQDLVAHHQHPSGMRTGVEKWNRGPAKVFELLTVDAYEGWTPEASERLAALEGKGNFEGFHANLTEYLGYDPLEQEEG